jgi:5-methylcytosine-specific restriction endonuclease McrA
MALRETRPDAEVFVENSPEFHGERLIKRLLKLGWNYRCMVCGISRWRGQPLSLHLDHLNGIRNDNRLENLRILCPNCHSQTGTYCKRNAKAARAR